MLVLEADSKQRFERIAFSPDGRRIVAGNWTGVYCWNLDATSKPEFLEAEGVNGLAFLSDGQLLIGTIKHGIRIHGTNGDCNVDLLDGNPSRYVAVSPDQPLFLETEFASPGTLRCYRISANAVANLEWKVRCEVPHPPAFLPDGKGIAVPQYPSRRINPTQSEQSPAIRFVSVKKGRQFRMDSLSHSLPHLAISADNRWYASIFENRIRYWSPDDKSPDVRWVENDSPERFCSLAFHPSNRFVAAASNDSSIKLYSLENWQHEKSFTWDIGRMRSLAFSPDGALAAAGSDTGKIVVWDVDL